MSGFTSTYTASHGMGKWGWVNAKGKSCFNDEISLDTPIRRCNKETHHVIAHVKIYM